MMKLYASLTSPFARKVRVAVIEWGLASRVEFVLTDPWASQPEFCAQNPLSKVPALLGEDGMVLPDSQLVLDYLAVQAGQMPTDNSPARWQAARRAQLADGIIDAAVATVIEKRRPENYQFPAWIERQSVAIDRALDALEGEVSALVATAPESLEAITTGCALAYLDLRQPQRGWRERAPGLAAWFAVYNQRPSMKDTVPPT